MNLVMVLPVAVFMVATAAVAIMVAKAADEAEQLWAEVRRVGQLRPLLVEIGDENHRLRATLANVRR